MQQFSWRWRLTELSPYGVRSAVKTQHNWPSGEKYLHNQAGKKKGGGSEKVAKADTLVLRLPILNVH